MGLKAVYNNQYLAVYVTAPDLEALLDDGLSFVSLSIGKQDGDFGELMVALREDARASLQEALRAERAAILKVQDEFMKAHPDYKPRHKRRRSAKYASERSGSSADSFNQDAASE
jgi:hypothetical protein